MICSTEGAASCRSFRLPRSGPSVGSGYQSRGDGAGWEGARSPVTDTGTVSKGRRVKKSLGYLGLFAAVALVSGAALLSYRAMQGGQSMSGIIVKYDQAALDVAPQPGTTSTLKIDRVLAPGPSWIVVSQVIMGPPRGMMDAEPTQPPPPMPKPRILAVVPVGAGEARDLIIPLDPGVPLTRMLLVVLHADRGVVGSFEWDMDRFAESPDKPYFVAPKGDVHSPLQLGMTVEVK